MQPTLDKDKAFMQKVVRVMGQRLDVRKSSVCTN